MSGESKKEEFRKYLERSGVIDALTKVLVALYEEPEKPANALDFIKQYLGAPTSGDVETMKAEKDELVKKNEELTKQLEVSSTPVPSCTAQQMPLKIGRCWRPMAQPCVLPRMLPEFLCMLASMHLAIFGLVKHARIQKGFVPCRSPYDFRSVLQLTQLFCFVGGKCKAGEDDSRRRIMSSKGGKDKKRMIAARQQGSETESRFSRSRAAFDCVAGRIFGASLQVLL